MNGLRCVLALSIASCTSGTSSSNPDGDQRDGATDVQNVVTDAIGQGGAAQPTPDAMVPGANAPLGDEGSELPNNPFAIDSPWQGAHRTTAMQASTALPGPTDGATLVSTRFAADSGVDLGVSPWHVLGSHKYTDRPKARALWGVTLTDAYKYIIDGAEFRFAGRFHLHDARVWIGWNFFGMAGDRIIVPSPGGLQGAEHAGSPCAGTEDALLELGDGSTSNSPIVCRKKFEFTPAAVFDACGFRTTRLGTTPVATGLMASGDIAVLIVRAMGANQNQTYFAVVNAELTAIKACTFLDDGQSTNQFPIEALSATKSAAFVATGGGIVKVTYDAATNMLNRVWKQTYAFRNGRTGTTPTLMNFGKDPIVVAVDSRCATSNVFTGAIACDNGSAPSRLVSFDRADQPKPPVVTDLPSFIRTTENSPAARGKDIVVCNYSGYTPDGPKDGVPEFSKGIVKLRWNEARRNFDIGWARGDLQCSGVASVSGGSNRVYFSGAEEGDRSTYQYALRLNDEPAGKAADLVMRLKAGSAFPSANNSADEVFDQGNNVVINDDGSIIWPSGHGLVRVR